MRAAARCKNQIFEVNNERKSKLGVVGRCSLFDLPLVESKLYCFLTISADFCLFALLELIREECFLFSIETGAILIGEFGGVGFFMRRDVTAGPEITPCGVIITPHRSKNNPINYDFFRRTILTLNLRCN